jgi:hypothetical protein
MPERYIDGGTIDADSFLRERIFHPCDVTDKIAPRDSVGSNESILDFRKIRINPKEV